MTKRQIQDYLKDILDAVDYFNADMEIIWKAVQEDMPQLKKMIAPALIDLNV